MTTITYEAELVDEAEPYVLTELCNMLGVHADIIVQMVEIGIVDAEGSKPSEWRFSGQACLRVKKAYRLRRDLGVNLAGAAVALDLLEDLELNRKKVRALETRLKQFLDGE